MCKKYRSKSTKISVDSDLRESRMQLNLKGATHGVNRNIPQSTRQILSSKAKHDFYHQIFAVIHRRRYRYLAKRENASVLLTLTDIGQAVQQVYLFILQDDGRAGTLISRASF